MSATTDFAAIVEDRDQKEQWIDARNRLIEAVLQTQQSYADLQDLIPVVQGAPDSDLKDTLIRQYLRMKSFVDQTEADAEYMALQEWRP